MGGRVRGRVEVEEGGQWWPTPLHGATHGGVKHGETVRMIDGILRRCRHAMGVYSPLPFAGELDAHTIKQNPRSSQLTPPGGARARGGSLETSSESP